MEIEAALQRLGFAEYEARAYVALVRRSPLNGYELAKASGIPRANVYGVLERLAARGAIVRLDEPGGTRYAPVAPAELLERIGGEFRTVAAEASAALEALEGDVDPEPVWNVRGYRALLDQARAAARAAKRSLLLAVWPQEATALREETAAAEAAAVDLTMLCLAACEQNCGGCRGHVYRYRASAADAPRRLVVVADDAEALAGEIGAGGAAHSVRTKQPLIVDLCRSSVLGSIALAAVVSDLGTRIGEALGPRARAALGAAAPAGDPGTFVERMRALRTSSPEDERSSPA